MSLWRTLHLICVCLSGFQPLIRSLQGHHIPVVHFMKGIWCPWKLRMAVEVTPNKVFNNRVQLIIYMLWNNADEGKKVSQSISKLHDSFAKYPLKIKPRKPIACFYRSSVIYRGKKSCLKSRRHWLWPFLHTSQKPADYDPLVKAGERHPLHLLYTCIHACN